MSEYDNDNYNAAIDERGICPEGFHVPSDEEWNTLAVLLDPSTTQDYFGIVSLTAGGMLKETGTIEDGDGYWQEPNDGATNETGFLSAGQAARIRFGCLGTRWRMAERRQGKVLYHLATGAWLHRGQYFLSPERYSKVSGTTP